MKLYDELVARGIIAQTTNEEELAELINSGKATFYVGFDPTADSLHVGHYVVLSFMRRLQLAGNRPIALIGGGTTLIGDPSGRTDMRKMLTREDIDQNGERFREQMARFIKFEGENAATMINNADWLCGLNYLDTLREVGHCFSVNRMLTAECYRNRMESGLSFLEFNYMILQSYDFYHLYQTHGCTVQVGGDDQWSNLLGGKELIRRKLGKEAHALTISLLATSDGSKMGKTQAGALWLDKNKTPVYDFYQYWRNVDDADVINCLKMMTFLPLEQISEMEKWQGAQLNEAKRVLAYELTTIVHGKEEADKAQEAAVALFEGGANLDNMPTTQLDATAFADGGITVCDLLVTCNLAPSRAEAKRLIAGGGVSIDDRKVEKFDEIIAVSDFGDGLIIKKGKKTYHRVVRGK